MNEDLDLSILKTGDIILFRTPFVWYKPISYLTLIIRAITHDYYNHAGIIIFNWSQLFINEAIGKGVVTSPISLSIKNYIIKIVRPKDQKYTEGEIATKANSKLGTGYDFLGLLFYQVIYQIKKKWYGYTQEYAEKNMYCSDYVAWIYNLKNWWTVTPKDIDDDKDLKTIYITNVQITKK